VGRPFLVRPFRVAPNDMQIQVRRPLAALGPKPWLPAIFPSSSAGGSAQKRGAPKVSGVHRPSVQTCFRSNALAWPRLMPRSSRGGSRPAAKDYDLARDVSLRCWVRLNTATLSRVLPLGLDARIPRVDGPGKGRESPLELVAQSTCAWRPCCGARTSRKGCPPCWSSVVRVSWTPAPSKASQGLQLYWWSLSLHDHSLLPLGTPKPWNEHSSQLKLSPPRQPDIGGGGF